MTEKERYATIGTWVEVFRKEGVSISRKTIRNRLQKANIIGQTARNQVGHVIRDGFYPESDIRNLCTDLLQDFPQADENGLFEKDGESYGTIQSLSGLLHISCNAIRFRIQHNSTPSIRGKDALGRAKDFYPLSGIRNLCTNLLESLPQADENGLFEKDGESYGTIRSLSRLLDISCNAIGSRIQHNSTPFIRGKDPSEQVRDFYSLSGIRNLCSDLLESLPQADENGLFEKDGETYGTVQSLSRLLSISPTTIQFRIQQNPPPSIRGKNSMGYVCDFYSASGVRNICADLIAKRKKSDDR